MKKVKFLSLVLTTSLIFSVTPVSANTQYTDSTHEIINVDTPITNDNNSNCDVYAELGSEFKVTIPKHITLDGATKKGTYNVSVEGDIAGKEAIKVIPDEAVTLSSKDKADVVATISQDKTKWTYNEILSDNKILGNGLIDANKITAGAWNGTFNFNVSLTENSIIVKAEDTNGTNLNATAENIEGTEKDILLNELEKSGLVDETEKVDALINVESDSFNDIAKTTFDVSSIAKEGDTVVILHYNEKTQEWEYIGTDIVDSEGKIQAEMNSFSPVAFVKIENATFEHIHKYTDTIQNSTCTENGVKTFICACGDMYTENIDATGHDFSDWTIIKNSTCVENGIEQRVCFNCNIKETNNLELLSHNWNTDYTVDLKSTCTEAGLKSIHCLDCNATKDSTVINATGHTEVVDASVTATCITNGLTEGKHCSVCNMILVKQEIVSATGHNYKSVITNSTCTTKGYTTHTCLNCSDLYIDSETEMLEHNYTSSITKEATCTEIGNRRYTCVSCSHAYDEVIAAKGHVYNSTQYVTDKVATCTETGIKSIHCTICNAKITGTEMVIPATGHNNINGGTDTIHTKCSTCGIITSTQHDYTVSVTKNATCTTTGVKTYTCSCKYSYTETIIATGHNYNTVYSASKTQHWKACLNNCGSTISLANHSDSGTDGLCDTCGYKGTIIYTYHTHDGNSSNGTGCYTLANYTTCGTYSTKVYNTCSSCNGSGNGSYVSGYYDDCSSCGGSGNGTYHSGYYNDCTNCNGNGSVSSTTGCSTCNSTGTITTTSTSSCGTCGGDGKVSSSSTSSCPEPDCERGQVLTYYKCDSCGYYNDISEYTWNNSECTKCGYDSTSDIYLTCSTCGGDDKVTTTTTSSCKNCGGDGKVSSSSSKKCTSCGGDGQVPSTSNCSKCNGSGKGSYVSGYYDDCSSCGGDGQGSWVSGYYENCSTCGGDGKTTIKHYKCTGCSATSSTSGGTHKYISSYSINCGKTTSTIESQYTEFK